MVGKVAVVGNYQKSRCVLVEPAGRKEYDYQADSEYDPPGLRKYFYIRKRQCDRDAVIEGRYRRCVKGLKSMIANIFTDDVKGILLSTIHKAKGLQNKRIFFLCPELIPSRYATMDWQFEQEMNLKYVAITRAQEELIYVSGKQFSNDITNYIKL